MEFDQAFQGSFDWNFPSPSATPTASHFPHHSTLQTPKTGSYPTHFQDAFSTPQTHIYNTPQQPLFSNAPAERPRTSSEYLSSNFYAHMPPPQAQGYSATTISPAHPHAPVQHLSNIPSGFVPAYDTAQMQTPPPTRGTSVKKPQQFAPVAFGTPSTIASRRHMTPQQNPHLAASDNRVMPHQTPMHFPQLQMSPDLYQFGNLGPASAPVVPSSQIFWDQAVSPGTVPQHRPLDDPFAPNLGHNVVFSNFAGPQADPQVTMFDTPAMRTFPVQAPHSRPSSAVALTSTQLPSQTLLPSTTIGVDPSLVYSSPVRQPVRSLSARKPRAEASKRKDSAIAAAAKPAVSEDRTVVDGSLRRSNTTGNARSPSSSNLAQVTATPVSQSHGVSQPPRTASPLKRVGKTPLGSISESRSSLRRSVILTVDENGRAQATKVDASPTRSIRDRYPGLFDSDSSDDEDESETSDHGSRTTSFSFAKGEERKAKAVKLDPPVENLEGLSIPRSSSVASNRPIPPSRAALAAVAQLRRHGSVKKKPVVRVPRKIDPNASSTSLIDSCPMDPGVGASVDRKTSLSPTDGAVPQKLAKDSATASPELLEGFNHHWGAMPSGHQQQRSEIQPNPLIRCVCGDGSAGLGQLMQCVSCMHWLHAFCVGVNPHVPQPYDYVCLYCANPGVQMQPLRRSVHG